MAIHAELSGETDCFAGGVVEAGAGRVRLTDIPVKNFCVECRGLVEVLRGNFEVAESRARKHSEAIGGSRDSGAPVAGADVAGVAGEEPAMAGEIFHAVLEFAVFRFVEFFDNFCAGGFCALVVRFDIFDENGEALSGCAQSCGSVTNFAGARLTMIQALPRCSWAPSGGSP